MVKIMGVILISLVIIFILLKKILLPFLNRLKTASNIQKKGGQTIGVIIDFQTESDPSGIPSHMPIVQYDVNNTIIKSMIHYPQNHKPEIGKKIKIYYDKNHPEVAIINPSDAIFKNLVVIVFISLIIILIVFFLVKYILQNDPYVNRIPNYGS